MNLRITESEGLCMSQDALLRLSEFVLRVMTEKGLTYPAVSAQGGPAMSTVHRIVHRSMDDLPKPATLRKLASGLGVPYAHLAVLAGYAPDDTSQAGSNHAPAMVSGFVKKDHAPQNGVNPGSAPGFGIVDIAGDRIPEGIPSGTGALAPGLRPLPAGEAHWKPLPMFEFVNCGDAGYLAPESPAAITLWPRSIAEGADAEIHVRGESMRGLGYVEGTVLLVRLLDGDTPPPGAEVIVRVADDGLICKILRRDAHGFYLEAAPGDSSGPWRRVLGPEDKILGEVVFAGRARRRH